MSGAFWGLLGFDAAVLLAVTVLAATGNLSGTLRRNQAKPKP